MTKLLDFNVRHVLTLSYLESARVSKKQVSLSDLRGVLSCSSAAITGIRDKLLKHGLVSDSGSIHDRRVRIITITPAGTLEITRFLQEIQNSGSRA